MPSKDEFLDESATIIQEIESNLEKALQKRKEEVEHELQEKIRCEKEESDRKLDDIQHEFDKERGTIKEFRSLVSEFESSRQTITTEMQDHLRRAMRYQEDIEKLTSLTLEELKKVGELSQQLSDLRQSSEKRAAEIKSKLKDRFGVMAATAAAEAQAQPWKESDADSSSDLEQELIKLKKIKQLLENDTPAVDQAFDTVASEPAVPSTPEAFAEPAAVPEEPDFYAPEPFTSEPPRPEFKMPEINQFIDDFMKQEPAPRQNVGVQQAVPDPGPKDFSPPRPAPATPFRRPDAKPDAAGPWDRRGEEPRRDFAHSGEPMNFQAVFESLERYRKTEAVDDAHEISYFQKGGRTILDGETLVRAISSVLESARKQVQKLAQTESPKDQFFLKQELINDQETLRKVVLRGVKICEKESAVLPRYSEDVMNLSVLKDILDKLTTDTWGQFETFKAFENSFEQMKDTFYRMITPPAYYLRSILDELET